VSLDARIVHRFAEQGDVSRRQTSSVSEFAFIRHRTTHSLAFACAAIWRSPTALTATAVPRIALTVRVYQTAGLPSALEKRALAEAQTVEQKRLFETAASHPEWEHVYCAAVLAANTSMRGVEVKNVRRKDVDLDKVWEVESATGMGVLYVGHSENETSKRKLPLNSAARDAFMRMLKRADELGIPPRSIIFGTRASTTTTTRPSRQRNGMARGGRCGTRPVCQVSGSTTCAIRSSRTCGSMNLLVDLTRLPQQDRGPCPPTKAQRSDLPAFPCKPRLPRV
jgi:integrase